MGGTTLKRISLPQAFLAIAVFLIPLIGGQISTDQSMPLQPGMGALIVSMLGGPFLQGFETPLLSHFVIGFFLAAAMIASLGNGKVIQLPNPKLIGLFIGFFGLLTLSVGLSDFRFASMTALGEWILYALAFFASVAICGRREGPKLVLTALYAGIVVVALFGIGFEYRDMRAIDPNYRIFGGWVNPNALAGMLIIGLLIGLSLAATWERGPKLLASLANVLIGVSVFLTGSKAGFGAMLVGFAAWALLAILWQKENKVRLGSVGLVAITVIASFGLYTAIQKANAPKLGGGPSLGRVAEFSETQAQSLEFRKLLWKGSLDLSIKHPTGYGIGTYRYEGSRPGLTTQTQLAHNSVLQIAVESSWLAAGLLMALLVLWLYMMFRGAKSMPAESNYLRTGIVAALLATFAHGIFESNLYYFGIGLTFFLLMGVGLNLSADSVMPEFTPKGVRAALSMLAAIPAVMLAYFGYAEYQRALIAGSAGSIEAKERAESLVSFAPLDGEAWNFLALVSPDRRTEAIERAAQVSPSPRILRKLADLYQNAGKFASSEGALTDALARDPNNLNTLNQARTSAIKQGDQPRAKMYAERMVAVEKTPYFKIRSLPQMVETATADARVYLASLATDAKSKIELLAPAVQMYRQFAETTAPEIKKFSADGGSGFAGWSAEKGQKTCEAGISAATELAKLYRETGATDKSTEVEEDAGVLTAALESLGGSK